MNMMTHVFSASPGAALSGEVENLLAQAGLRLALLPPCMDTKGDGLSIWVHEESLDRIRRFRGAFCLSHDIVPPEAVDAGGYHHLACDAANHHLLMLETNGSIAACLRFRMHPPGATAGGLRMFEAVRRMPPSIQASNALNTAIHSARSAGLGLAELGGYALSTSRLECPVTALLPLAAWAMVQTLGGALMLEYADASPTARHTILRDAGSPLTHHHTPVPAFFDSRHGRSMHILCVRSSAPPANAEATLAALRAHLQTLTLQAA